MPATLGQYLFCRLRVYVIKSNLFLLLVLKTRIDFYKLDSDTSKKIEIKKWEISAP